jgi:hypothetical protein
MLSYLKDTNAVEVYDGANWVASDDPNAIQNTIVDAKGDLISATGNDTPARLAVGNNGETLVADSSTATGLKYQAPTVNTVIDAKGDLLAGTAADTVARLAVGATNDTVLTVDSSTATGLKYSADWTTFTPTWTATTTNPVIGNGTLTGKYIKIGKTVIAQYRFVAGSTTTFGSGNYRFSLPINADRIVGAQGGVAGSLFMEDNGVANFQSTGVRLPDADRIEFLTSSTLPVSNSSPFTWANGDFFMGEIVYGVA